MTGAPVTSEKQTDYFLPKGLTGNQKDEVSYKFQIYPSHRRLSSKENISNIGHQQYIISNIPEK